MTNSPVGPQVDSSDLCGGQEQGTLYYISSHKLLAGGFQHTLWGRYMPLISRIFLLIPSPSKNQIPNIPVPSLSPFKQLTHISFPCLPII